MLDIGTAKFDRCDHSSNQENHLDNISGIRTRAIEIVNVLKVELRWKKDITRQVVAVSRIFLLFTIQFPAKWSYL